MDKMNFQYSRRLNSLTCFGLIAIAVANTATFVLQRHTSYPERITDPVIGFLYGTAIALVLLGIWRQRRTVGGRCA
jgi:hypothetical protein